MTSLSYKNIILLSIPATLSVMIEPLAGVIDTAFVGQMSTTWLAAMALAATTFSTLTWIFNFLIYGVTARVATLKGESKTDEIGAEIQMTFVVALISGTLATTLLLNFDEFILRTLLGASDELIEVAIPYFKVRAWNFPLVLLITVSIGILRGSQKLTQAFYLLSAITVSNIALTYYFLFIEKLGFIGAAWGTVLSYLIGTAISFFLLFNARKDLGLTQIYKFEIERVFQFGNNSLNIFLRTASLTGSFFIMTSVASRLSPQILAAHQVLFQFWIIPPFVIDGLAIVATSYGGEALGRGQKREFYELGLRLINLGILLGSVFMAIYTVFFPQIASLFSNDKNIISLASSAFLIPVALQIPNALVYIYDGLLFGASRFEFLRKRMIEGLLFLFLPLSLLSLFETKSLLSIWISLSLLYLYRLISSAIYFHHKKLGLTL